MTARYPGFDFSKMSDVALDRLLDGVIGDQCPSTAYFLRCVSKVRRDENLTRLFESGWGLSELVCDDGENPCEECWRKFLMEEI